MEVLQHSSAGRVDFGCVGVGGMDLQPPWAGELLARNRKVARNIWSTSDLSDLTSGSGTTSHHHWGRSFSIEDGKGEVVDPVKFSTGTSLGGAQPAAASPSSSSSVPAKETMRTEKAAPMRMRRDRDASIEGTDEADIKIEMKENILNGNSGEESILEYGPGIVRKLRSKYQSLALRHISLRPSLRRAASLENGLDLDPNTPVPTPEPSPRLEIPEVIPEPPPPPEITRTRAFRSNMTLNINDGTNFSRGRSEVNRRARMTRARSVDALHRVERTPQEEEILEKFKTVVEPKEEVVIIEVLKPRRNLGISNGNISTQVSSPVTNKANSTLHDKAECYSANANVNGNANACGKGTAGVGGHSTGSSDSQLARGRTLASPEYELPPADIVRETARIFETNPAGSHWKVLARQAIKSASLSPVNTPTSPTPPPSTGLITTSANPIVTNPEKLQNGPLMSSTPIPDKEKQQLNNISGKQIGVIRPTVNGVSQGHTLPLNFTKTSPGIGPATVNVNITETNNKVATTTARLLSNNKPPLSPKPMFISQQPSKNQLNVNGHFKGVETRGLKEAKEVTNRTNSSPSPDSLNKPKQNQPNSNNNNNPKDNNTALVNGNGISPAAMKESESLGSNKSKVNHFPVVLKPVNAKPSSTTTHVEIPTSQQQKRNDLNRVGNVSFNNPSTESNKPTIKSTIGTIQQSKLPNNVTDSGRVPSIMATMSGANDVKSSGKDAENNNGGKKTKDGSGGGGDTGGVPSQQQPQQSELRARQKQKFSEQNGGGGSIVFNFTDRRKVPDYIEDDGLHRSKSGSGGDEDDVDSIETDKIDPKLFQFIGANVIINGKSSIQKKPKSQKLNISFNESGPVTFEYPSESSILTEDDSESSKDKDNLLGQKTPNLINGSGGGGGLGSYTPSKVNSLYELGSYKDKDRVTESINNKKSAERLSKNKSQNGELIEDYLKPDTEGTTWSNEIGAADILF